MALTLEAEQRMKKAKLVEFFDNSRDLWKSLAQHSFEFVKSNFPAGESVRADDVAKALVPLLEVNSELISALNSKKLTQKYWISDFCDLILDRTWNEIRT